MYAIRLQRKENSIACAEMKNGLCPGAFGRAQRAQKVTLLPFLQPQMADARIPFSSERRIPRWADIRRKVQSLSITRVNHSFKNNTSIHTPFRGTSVWLVLLPAAAFQPLITDDTGTQGALGNQFEFAFDRDRIRMAGNKTGMRTLPFTATRGLTDSQDIFLGISHVRIDGNAPGSNASGSGNPVLGAKWRLLETADSKTSIGFKPEFVLPVSATREAAGLGTGRASWNLTLIVTQEIPFGAVHANLATGRNRFRDSAAPEITRLASVAPDWDVMPKWKLALDAGVVSAKVGGVKTQSRFIELGAIHSLSDVLDFALGFVRARDSAVPRTNTDSATIVVI